MNIINPATEELIRQVEEDNRQTLRDKLAMARESQYRWQEIVLADRIAILQRFVTGMEKDIESLAATLTSEVGKPLQQSRNEIRGAITRTKWLAASAPKYLQDEIMFADEHMEERISYEPLGTICNISAWNYPLLVGVNVFVPALLAGNAVLYKPSEYATLTGMAIRDLLRTSGIPAGVFEVAVGGREVGEMLLDLPFGGYFFTGSYKTGLHVFEKASARMIPCVCELGGKDPLYVTEDITDIQAVAAATADGAFYNNGQSCCAVERIYVHEKVYDRYLNEFVRQVGNWKIGAPADSDTYFGPLTRKEQRNVLEEQISDARLKGAKVLTGGKAIIGTGYYFEPTVLVETNHTMTVMMEESFGPVIGIMKVSDDTEAVKLMKDTEYGLTASVYCNNIKRAKSILREINSGTGYWNCCDRVSAALPWSGRKHSGIGVTLSHAGLRTFTRPKAYHLKKPIQ